MWRLNSRRSGAAQHRPSTWSADMVCAARCHGLPRRASAAKRTEQAIAAKRAEQKQHANKRAHPDLNQGPADLQSAALTTELCTHCGHFQPCREGIETPTHAELLVFLRCGVLRLVFRACVAPLRFGAALCVWPYGVLHFMVVTDISFETTEKHQHQWSSGRIHRCHRCDPGSIPG